MNFTSGGSSGYIIENPLTGEFSEPNGVRSQLIVVSGEKFRSTRVDTHDVQGIFCVAQSEN